MIEAAVSFYTKIRNMPFVWPLVSKVRNLPGFHWLWKRWFRSSGVHWQRHYKRGGDLGPGSYGESATYKADLINKVIRERGIYSIIEFGCGDGNQLSYLEVDQYIGLDISKVAIQRCIASHGGSAKRSFIWYDPNYFHDPLHIVGADCAMSLDVIFHLIEDDVFDQYLRTLFNCGRRFVIIYGLDVDEAQSAHVSVRFRKFSKYIATRFPEFRVSLHVPRLGKFGDFYLYERV